MSEKLMEKIHGIKETNLAKHVIHDIELSKSFDIIEAAGFIQINIFLTSSHELNEVTYKIDFEMYHKYLYNKIKELKGAKQK